MKTKTVLLYSGGLDSYITGFLFRNDIDVVLYVDLNTTYSEKERKVVTDLPILFHETEIYSTVNMKDLEDTKSFFVPCRNLILSIFASHYGNKILLGGLKEDRVVDNHKGAFKDFSEIVSIYGEKPVTVISPIRNFTKTELVKEYFDRGGQLSELWRTTSCYDKKELYCGRCNSCFRKFVAFKNNKIKIEFYNDKLLDAYKTKAKNKEFIPQRNKEILRALK